MYQTDDWPALPPLSALVNRVHHMDALELLALLPDASVDLIATDPPYNGVKDEAWDNQWATDADFIAWLDSILREYKRVLKPNGSLYLFASPRMAARVEIAVQNHFNVLNRITWRKPPYSTKAEMFDKETMRGYFPASEAIIFAEQYGAEGTYQTTDDDLRGYILKPMKDWFREQASIHGLDRRKVNEVLGSANTGGGMATHYFGSGDLFELPTQAMYSKLQLAYPEVFNRPYEQLRQQYEQLRQQYEQLRRPFTVTDADPYTDVWTFKTVNAYDGKHPAEKPLDMMRHIVRASSRPGAVVLDTFSGSGTTADAARREGRDFIACDFDTRWAKYGGRRVTLPFTVNMFEAMPELLAAVSE